VPDVVAPGLRVLFVGINPSLYSGAVGHHFARPGNRFWRVLYGAGITDRVLSSFEERILLDAGVGITNLVERATASAAVLSDEELRRGGRRLARKVARSRPRVVAVLGVSAYRIAFDHPRAIVGPQEGSLGTGRLWVLPNPSGLNAHYQLLDLVRLYAEMWRQAGAEPRPAE
jgi:TDG/mug DNA glycosylase family protein